VAQARGSRHAGAALPFAEVVPSQEWVDGAELLDGVRALVRKFVVLDDSHSALCALWIALSYLAEVATVLPILAITSPEKGCGKSTLLGVIGRLACRPVLASNV